MARLPDSRSYPQLLKHRVEVSLHLWGGLPVYILTIGYMSWSDMKVKMHNFLLTDRPVATNDLQVSQAKLSSIQVYDEL